MGLYRCSLDMKDGDQVKVVQSYWSVFCFVVSDFTDSPLDSHESIH